MPDQPTVKYRFYGEFGAPGFHELTPIWAASKGEAQVMAERYALEPWKGWPLVKEHIRVSILDWDAIILPDGRSMLRRQYEEETQHAAE